MYSKGFESTRDIFELIYSSSFFKKEMFSELNRPYGKDKKKAWKSNVVFKKQMEEKYKKDYYEFVYYSSNDII